MRLLVTHHPHGQERRGHRAKLSAILNAEVVNFSHVEQGTRPHPAHQLWHIGYDTPWRQVEAMLLEAAARTPGLLR